MRLQFKKLADYERRRAIAMASGRDSAFDLVDGTGRVLQSFQQTSTMDADDAAYYDARDPPMDEATRKFNAYRGGRRRRQRPAVTPPKPSVPRTSGVKLTKSFAAAPRPAGNVVEF